MWCLVWGNVLRFPKMFKNSHVWLQIALGNQMPGIFRFPLNPLLIGLWIFFKTSGYLDSQA